MVLRVRVALTCLAAADFESAVSSDSNHRRDGARRGTRTHKEPRFKRGGCPVRTLTPAGHELGNGRDGEIRTLTGHPRQSLELLCLRSTTSR